MNAHSHFDEASSTAIPGADAPIVEHAIFNASLGRRVFPVPPSEKKSYYKASDRNGNRKWGQTDDPIEIRHYWKVYPNANLGIVTGAVSGLFVVETDTAAGHGEGVDGAAELKTLEAKHGALPPTLQAVSPSGSVHRYFKHPGIKVWSTDSWIAPGVDCKGDGGMVVAPPSVVPAREATADKPAKPGGVYSWRNDLPIAVAPQWLLDVVCVRQAKRKSDGPPSQKQQARRERKGKIAGAFRNGEKPSRETIADALRYVPNDVGYNGWIQMGFALYHGLGASGIDLWEDWSAKSTKYNANTTKDKWPSFAGGDSITINTLFFHAKEKGWRRSSTQGASSATGGTSGAGVGGAPLVHPTIRISGGELPSIVTQAEQALISGNMEIYQRGSLIVRPAHSRIDIADGNTTTAIRLAPVKSHLLVELMTLSANFERYDKRENDWVPIDCPLNVAETYMARDGMWNLPVLAGLVNCPVLRSDGSVLEVIGYDAATGLLFDPQGVKFDQVPDNPDKAAALRALAVLKGLISTFPFVTDADRAVALSGILTAIHRRSLPTAPVHCLSAPTAGTGKSMIVDIASEIVDGRRAAVMALGRSDEEAEKRLGSALIAGDSIISIDNIDRPFGGELYCQALTQPTLRIRPLGLSKLVDVPSNATMFANGNNLTLVGDMTRRAVMCTMDSGEERPELRQFARKPLAMVRADRNKYVIAALTILRAFHVAGRPSQKSPLGSFSEWSSWIRDALIWLGETDPCDTMERIRQNDPKLGAVIAVVSQWADVVGYDRQVTTKDLIDYATEQKEAATYRLQREFVNPEFREALLIVAGDGGSINSRRMGIWLGSVENRLVNGCKIVRAGGAGGVVHWKLKPPE
jgi:putative DNA primase/helicase